MNNINDKYFGSNPFSYGGKYRLYEKFKKKDVDKELENNDIYTRFKQYRKSKIYSPIYVYKKRELFQSDVIFFTGEEFVNVNHGYKFLFTTIDVFTKMAWIYPMKNNKCRTVMECFKDIVEKCGEKPERLNSDRGSELICKQFATYLKDNGIHHYLSYSLRKCPVIERFNLTIQTLLYKIMRKNNSYEWVKFLDQAMKIYLNRKHRTIKMSPLEAEKAENEIKVRGIYLERYRKADLKRQKVEFSVGDTVRIFKKRGTFHRGYNEDFTDEIFTVTKVLKNLPVPRYKIKEYNGEDIIGSFFQDELVRYNPPEFYEIDVLKSRGNGKKKEYFIHYRGWPSKYDEWKKESDLKLI